MILFLLREPTYMIWIVYVEKIYRPNNAELTYKKTLNLNIFINTKIKSKTLGKN